MHSNVTIKNVRRGSLVVCWRGAHLCGLSNDKSLGPEAISRLSWQGH